MAWHIVPFVIGFFLSMYLQLERKWTLWPTLAVCGAIGLVLGILKSAFGG